MSVRDHYRAETFCMHFHVARMLSSVNPRNKLRQQPMAQACVPPWPGGPPERDKRDIDERDKVACLQAAEKSITAPCAQGGGFAGGIDGASRHTSCLPAVPLTGDREQVQRTRLTLGGSQLPDVIDHSLVTEAGSGF